MVLAVTSKDSSTTIVNNNNSNTNNNIINSNIKLRVSDENYDSNKENNFNQNNISPTSLTPKQSAPVPVLPPSQQRQISPRQQPAVFIANPNVATVAPHHQHHAVSPLSSGVQLPNNPFLNQHQQSGSHSDFHPRPSTHKRDSQLLSNSMPSLTTFFQNGQSFTPPATPRLFEDSEYSGTPDRAIHQDKPLLKKSRNSQTILRLDHLSIDQGIPSPLSRSTSELSISDSGDSDHYNSPSITRSNTFCGDLPSSTNLRRSLSRQLDFSAPHINIPSSSHSHSLPFNYIHHQSVSSPSSPLLAPQMEPFSLSAPNTFLLSGAYPSSPEASPASTPIKELPATPMRLVQHPVTPNIHDSFDTDASPSQPSTPLVDLLNNCDSSQPHTSPYKTPSKSQSHFVARYSDSSSAAAQSLYQSSDSVLANFKKRGRTDLPLYNGFIAPNMPTSKSFINFSTTSSELSNNNNHNNNTSTNNSTKISPNTWKKASPDVSKPLPFPLPERTVFITNSINNCYTNNINIHNTANTTHVVSESEYNLKLPLCNGKPGYNNITPETLSMLMEDVKNNITVIDCRYTYEYDGGHIKNAINIPPHHSNISLQRNFFDKPPANNKRIIIFHCEFSSKRAPDCYTVFRDIDRKLNCYPNVHYPEIYLLNGGYKKFFETFPEKCTKDYVKMDDPRYTREKRKEEEKKKKEEVLRSKLGRSQSFHV